MDKVLWVLIRSWHRIAHNGETTLCGRDFSPLIHPIAPDFGNGRTCEACLRVASKRGL